MKKPQLYCMIRSLGLALALVASATTARAFVYATDIKINGNLTNVTAPALVPLTITYRLNQEATLGVSVVILQGGTPVTTLSGGTHVGLNSVSWTPTVQGNYSVNITAAASGFPFWTQISFDPGQNDAVTGGGTYAFDPNGMAVDCNTNSPYYGRVILGCSYEGGANPVTGAYNYDGIYKMNADGSFADEGGFGFGGYTTGDGFATNNLPNEMPSGSFVIPWMLRIGADDRIYMLDYSFEGAIVSFDMQVTNQFQVVIDEGIEGYLSTIDATNSYGGCPDFGDLSYGIGEFDVLADANGNGSIYLCNNDDPNWGIWMFHLINGQSDTNDTGTQAVYAGSGSSMDLVSSGGCTVDTNLDIFGSQTRYGVDSPLDFTTMVFSNWNGGVLPPDNSGFDFSEVTASWGDGPIATNDFSWEGVVDTVINNRTNPTLLALPLGYGNDTPDATGNGNGGGIKVLNTDGSYVSVTNGDSIQTLTNLDWGNEYSCATWDNLGNLYAASPTTNVWRAWSPPGPNTNTTLAVVQLTVGPPEFIITGISISPTTPGCSIVTITFTAPGNPAPSALKVIGSPTVNGTYSTVSGAVITGGSGSYQATFPNCSTEFYKIEEPSRIIVATSPLNSSK